MSMQRMLFVSVFALVALAFSLAQSVQPKASAAPGSSPAPAASSTRDTLTIEELYLSQEVEIQLLRNQAFNNNRDSKTLALLDIKGMVESGKVTKDSKEVMAILDALAGEGVYRVVKTDGSVSNNFPEVRRDAVAILGKVGGKVAHDTLYKVLTSDREPMVLAEAVYALGVAPDANKDSLVYLAEILHSNSALALPDQNLSFSALLSVEKIAAKLGGINDPDVINGVLDVVYGRYQRNVVQKALEVLKKMRAPK